MMEMMMKKDAETEHTFKNHAATIHNLEVQNQQMVKALESRNQGGLPSTTEENPRDHLKAIELRIDKPPPPLPFVPKVPFQHRVKKPQDTCKFHKLLETFKKLQINISLAYALREMPHYAKFLKEIITNKRSWDAEGPVPMTEKCSSIILSNLPTKLKDLGSFTIPCTIGNMQSLADHSLKKPHGIVEDVLVKVNKFIFPVEFVVLDNAADKEFPMILGRPFMYSGRALIDVHDGKLTLRIGDESVEFDMRKITRHLNSGGELEEKLAENKAIMPSMPSKEEEVEEEEYIEEPVLEPLLKSKHITPSSSEKPPKVELKILPAHLRYAFLGADSTLPIIISNKLTKNKSRGSLM
ncbi:uncharacterized protein LOC126661797 [Mercurialis annua]|uniref:uncharacterized protein LOC126661797 n=1 Tax=Mercurialis annua TaxID=3986 RepID=UPI00215E6B4E|nr:uncharacterized protein LOC126661797 [Mercurialis annua]